MSWSHRDEKAYGENPPPPPIEQRPAPPPAPPLPSCEKCTELAAYIYIVVRGTLESINKRLLETREELLARITELEQSVAKLEQTDREHANDICFLSEAVKKMSGFRDKP